MSAWNITVRALASDARAASYDAVSPSTVLLVYPGGGGGGGGGNWSANDSTFSDGNSTTAPRAAAYGYEVWQAVLIIIACSVIIVGTVVGNALVCLAVLIVNKLRTPSNLLIVSLAVSDLLVAVLVMPFATSQECLGRWVLGETFCYAWTSLDVLLCTASILNLCVISIDRYLVITRPFQYAAKRTTRRMLTMILAVWSLAAIVSLPPLLGWGRSGLTDGVCSVSQSFGYQIYATVCAFYAPLSVMVFIYYRIYKVSSRMARKEARSVPPSDLHHYAADVSGRSSPQRKDSAPEENHNCRYVQKHSGQRAGSSASDATTAMLTPGGGGVHRTSGYNGDHRHRRIVAFFKKGGGGGGGHGGSNSHKTQAHDCKATKTLGLIMGSFTACWLPFFIIALGRSAFCRDPPTCIPDWLTSLFLWLGYANSLLNPVIYARFNLEFRRPFREILLCRCCGINRRLRSESYAEQYGGGSAGPAAPRHAMRPPACSVVRYNSDGQTEVRLGNGTTAT